MVDDCNSSTEFFRRPCSGPSAFFFLGTQLTDKVLTARKRRANAIFPALKELVGVCL